MPLDSVKNIFIVLSGKGGVGKSTVSTQLALALKDKGFKVGLLDIDLCGPSVPYLLQLENKEIHQCPEGWVPVYADTERKLAVMSIGFLLPNRNNAVVWRGPKKTAMIRQFLNDVFWQELDYLIIDTPPGTSDEHITVMENLKTIKCNGAIVVTTPQAVAIEDVRKELTFCQKTGIKILGIVENMSGFVCPHCTECTNVFSTGGGELLAEKANVPFLGRIPLDPRLGQCSERGESCLITLKDSPASQAIDSVICKLTQQVP
ncbi:cytosolic Fe-S cluster assembly factor NUBP2 homolog [Neocloeon triangulifer]|uniref:cytosolic Fe-S cluster assembly factor NUBP2 homolog n=1 Tax=Neocloeon triangulifer TaxID=2078957 RepID=UPI00286EE994|nr:cytosolic Fe-S cluster assembly factor NUBP2 homolog [Neocloeon triangulifer]